MGSWDETCALSNLPIMPGEEVYWLILSRNVYHKFDKSGCYHNDFFFVRSIPLLGVYDDYGEIEIAEGEEIICDSIIRQYKQDVVSWLYEHHKKDDGKSRQEFLGIPEVRPDNISISNLQNWFHEGMVYVNWNVFDKDEHAIRGVPTTKVMVRKDVWDSLLACDTPGFLGEKIDISFYGEKVNKIISELEDREGPLDFADKFIIEDILDQIIEKKYFRNSPNKACMALFDKYLNKEISREQLEKVLHRVKELATIENVMASTRRAWMPTVGAGSQETNFNLHAEVHSKIVDIAREVERKLEEDEY